jgi:NAD(P)-dependent dehydrogenase (short-subunit alcohol dehydrogenase family)
VLDRLLRTSGSRIVTVSSIAHRRGVIDFDDLQSERSYDASDAYAQSKLANWEVSGQLTGVTYSIPGPRRESSPAETLIRWSRSRERQG